PFIVGGLLLGPIGWIIRRRVRETPVFTRDVAGAEPAPVPLKRATKLILQAIGIAVMWNVGYYGLMSYLATFLTQCAGVSASVGLWANVFGLSVTIVTLPYFGHLSDRVGRRKMLLL